MQFLKLLFTLFFIFLGGLTGYLFSHLLNHLDYITQNQTISILQDFVLTSAGIIVGFLISPYFFSWFLNIMENLTKGLEKLSLVEILALGGGVIFGLIVSSFIVYVMDSFLSTFLHHSSEMNLIRPFFIIFSTLFCTTLVVLMTTHLPFFGKGFKLKGAAPKILDSSAVIDGRIADVIETGFTEGGILVPKFVLEEIQKIADSSDSLKRNRGRRGLDILNRMRQSKLYPIQILEKDFPDGDVDAKLVRLAKEINGAIVTNDYNLNKVAQFQGVQILNINDLTRALKPVVLPGEEIKVQVIREGKEHGQGIGYLDDGTMIVIENGRKHVGDSIEVEVSSILQTSAGKMIFAKPKFSG